MNLVERLKKKREDAEKAGYAKKIDRSKAEGLLEKLKILKKKKNKK